MSGALWSLALCHCLRRDVQAVWEHAGQLLALATEQGFAHWVVRAQFLRGWTLVERQNCEEGIAQIQRAVTQAQSIGEELMLLFYLGLLAEVYRQDGHVETGLDVIKKALGMMQKNGERWCEAELYRIKGELLRQHAKGK